MNPAQVRLTDDDGSLAESLADRYWIAKEAGSSHSLADICREYPHLVPRVRQLLAASAANETGRDSVNGSEQATDHSTVPKKIGPFQICHVLGQGGMGVVFEAYDATLDRKLAIKLIRLDTTAPRPPAGERFLREARAAAKVQHDNILPVFQFGEHEGKAFLAMPLLAGETLEDRLKLGELCSIAFVLKVGRECAAGLAAAHAAGIIHRDIKPSNLWLERIAPQTERVNTTAQLTRGPS